MVVFLLLRILLYYIVYCFYCIVCYRIAEYRVVPCRTVAVHCMVQYRIVEYRCGSLLNLLKIHCDKSTNLLYRFKCIVPYAQYLKGSTLYIVCEMQHLA